MKYSTRSIFGVLLLCLVCAPAWASPQFTTLHSFDQTDGLNPSANLIQGADGLLYGTTFAQGSNGYGNVFKIDNAGGNFAEIFSFDSTDGASVTSNVIQLSDGTLYGTTWLGGANNAGTVYEMAANGTGYIDLHDFGASAGDGQEPLGGLVQGSDGNLYGTTEKGGANNVGTIYKIAPGGGPVTILYSFGTNDLQLPQSSLVVGEDGSLYGTAYQGGASGFGGIFRINEDGTGYTVLHSFAGGAADGANCYCALTPGGDGYFYGVTYAGGSNGNGAIFKIAPDGAGYQTIYNFAGGTTDGSSPEGTLVLGNDEKLYGTTRYGGPNGSPPETDGTLFDIARGGTGYTLLHSFAGSDGANPLGGLIQGTDGGFYGTTYGGGANSDGTVFSLTNGLSASPTGLRVLGSDAQVQLFWNTDTLGTSYNLYRATTSGGEGNTPYQTGLTNPYYYDNGVTQGTQYFYQVTSVNGGTESAKSYEVTGTPMMAISDTDGLSVSPSPVEATQTSTGTVTLQIASSSATKVFLSSSDPSVTFASPDLTVPANQTSQNFTIYTANTGSPVTATITASENGTDATATLSTTVPPILHTFQPGLQMISAPSDDSSVTLANLFAQQNPPLAVWTGTSYVVTPTAPANTIVPGQGYWVHPGSSVSLYDLGTDTTPTSPIDVSLSAGWNMVGDAMNVQEPVSSLQVKVGTTTYTYANANKDGIVGATFYTWQPNDTAYEMVTASSGSLQPFIGYWVYAFKPCTLIFPASA